MRLTVQLFASLRELAGRETLFLEDAPATLDVAGLKELLEQRHPELGRLVRTAGATVVCMQ